MKNPFRITVSKDQLTAYLSLSQQLDLNFTTSVQELLHLLKNKGITYGIDDHRLKEIAENPHTIHKPIIIARGNPPIHGKNGYIELTVKKDVQKEKENFRNILDIMEVKKGEKIATIIPETSGENGVSVFGNPLPAKKGRPCTVRPGKNVAKEGNDFFALEDGQVNVTEKYISVNPVFRVSGDLDMKTGNIHFVGNVVIHGNVPTGYEVEAGGDIHIFGLVEGAYLKADGNISISGGIASNQRGRIIAKGSVRASYVNQGNIEAGQDIIITSSLLHSKVIAKRSILSPNGKIIGGTIIAGDKIIAKDIGNRLNTRTEVIVGFDPILKKEEDISKEIEAVQSNLKKLNTLGEKLLHVIKLRGDQAIKEKSLLKKQQLTKKQLLLRLDELNKTLQEITDKKTNDKAPATIEVYGDLYPNTIIRIGNLVKPIQQIHTFVKFYQNDKDIVFEPLK